MSAEEFESLKKELKVLLAGYKKLTPAMISKLAELGFILVRRKNHYMFDYFLNGKKLRFEVDKTPGDFRSGIKTACVISRVIKREAGL
ncbi:MAG: hypothetical protein K5866_06305 [Treponema sp.]|nr:hypothetical protein [Treponema sp.]